MSSIIFLILRGHWTAEVGGVGVPQKIKAPSWVTRGLHSEGGGGRGLTAWDAVCWIYTINLRSCCLELFLVIFQGMRRRRKGPEPGQPHPRRYPARSNARAGERYVRIVPGYYHSQCSRK